MYVPILAMFVRAELQDNKNQSGMTLTHSLRKLSGYRFVNTAGGLPPSPSSIGEPERSGSFSTALLMMCGVRANVFQFGGKFTLVARTGDNSIAGIPSPPGQASWRYSLQTC